MLDFLLEEREQRRIRHLGWSFHGDIEVFNRVLEMHRQVHWDFVQIQLNYVDWRHASAYNADWQKAIGDDTNAEYLYGELAKRDIPVVVMEPLLGGRLANVTQDVRPYEAEASGRHRRGMGVPLRRVTPEGADRP